MTHDEKPTSNPAEALALDPLYVPGLIEPLQTPGADGGVNRGMLYIHAQGLLISLLAYPNMQQGDWVRVYWGNDSVPVTEGVVLPEQVGESFPLFIAASKVPEGINDLYATVTRQGSGNDEDTLPLAILVRTLLPGGTDPRPDLPGHQNLSPAEPKLPPSGIIDEDAAKAGVEVTIPGYEHIRVFDTITFSWGGVQFTYEVTEADVQADKVELLVTEDIILAAGPSDALVLVYWVWDEVHNLATDWSMPATVTVEIGEGLFDPPMIENPDPNADPYDVIDLDTLGDDDLLVDVMVYRNGFEIGDLVTLTWVGTTAQGQTISVTPPAQEVSRDPQSLPFIIPNADIRVLGQGRGVASYTVTRDGAAAGVSKRAFVAFTGAEASLPKPRLPDAVEGVLDPTLALTSVVIPGAALEAGDRLIVTWFGTRASGSPLVEEFTRSISGGGAGQPVTLPIDGPRLLAPLDGGSLAVYYKLIKGGVGPELNSEREQVRVGEAVADLPAPTTRPPAEDGVLDPDDVAFELEIVVAPYPGMEAGQTVRLFWRASAGPVHEDFMPLSPGLVGKDVIFYMDRSTLESYDGAEIVLTYQVEMAGQPTQISEATRFAVGAREEMDSGPMRVMGARASDSVYLSWGKPRMLTALHDQSLLPMRAAWWYEGEDHYTLATEWNDTKPWLPLYVRNGSETWKCTPTNIFGSGAPVTSDQGSAAFVAMRDEVMGDDGIVADMVAWGREEYGGELDEHALKNVMEVSTTSRAFAARLRDGSIACWGEPTDGGSPRTISGDFLRVYGNGAAFVAQRRNGELHAWGRNEFFGVPIPQRVLEHRDYIAIFNASNAFAALRATGHVVAWGDDVRGGQLKPGQELMNDIVQIHGNIGGFAALRVNGNSRSVISWGDPAVNNDVPEEIARLTNISTLGGTTHYAFSVILDTGEVKVWGSGQAMLVPDDIAKLTNVVEVTGTADAYCARLRDGTVAVWGNKYYGGELTQEVADRTDIAQVTSNTQAFVGVCRDGSVVAWGYGPAGGDTSSVAGQLKDVRAVYPNNNGFCALTKDGRVVTWGVGPGGGDSSAVQGQLNRRVTARRLLPPAEAEAVAKGLLPARRPA